MTSMGIFSNEKLSQQLEKRGYVVIPFANTALLTELGKFYYSLSNLPSQGTHVTMFNPSYDYRKTVDEKIKELCALTACDFLPGYRPLYANFMVKEPGLEGDFPLHQDWTYVDETRHRSYAFWIPLHDVDETNGALNVVSGSHRFITALRGPHVHEPFSRISSLIKEKYSVAVKLEAGEALLWDHRLLHFSRPNLSKNTRIAFTLIMVPQHVPVIHCYGISGSDQGAVEVFDVDTDFFMRYVISRRPEGVSHLNTVYQGRIDFSEDEFARAFSTANI